MLRAVGEEEREREVGRYRVDELEDRARDGDEHAYGDELYKEVGMDTGKIQRRTGIGVKI